MESSIFARDLPALLSEVYIRAGLSAPPDFGTTLIDLVEWILRLPSRNARATHLSDVLRRHKVLTTYEIAGIGRVQSHLEGGLDVRPFLGDRTRSIRNRQDKKTTMRMRNDLFFSDWGLHHFHLGADLKNTGQRVMRSRRVLIAYLTECDAYLLDVVPHGKGFSDVWGDKTYLETLHRNWPNALERYELRGISALPEGSQFDANERITLRASGVSTSVVIGGRVFIGPGLGIASDGTSVRAVRQADEIRYELCEGERLFRAQLPEVDDAYLFVGKDASVGFFTPETHFAYRLFPGGDERYRVTGFFKRLLQESGILDKVPDNAIWLPPGVPRITAGDFSGSIRLR